MTRSLPAFSALLALAAGSAVIAAGVPFAREQLARMDRWHQTAEIAPEGDATGALFDRAVAAGAIAWDDQTRSVVMRRDLDLPADLATALFRIGESGTTIAAELRRAGALNHLIALRHRTPGCAPECAPADWNVAAPGLRPDSAQALALGASFARPDPGRAPSPRLHAALSRDSGTDVSAWQSWTAQAPLTLSADLADAAGVDVIGRLEATPPGWQIAHRWCRQPQGRLIPCDDPDQTAAVRLVPTAAAPGRLTGLTIAPVPVLPADPPQGRYRLTERIALRCDADGTCVPEWVANHGRRPYARPSNQAPADATADPTALLAALGPWADPDAGPSDLARTTGALAVVGQNPEQRGSLLSALADLPAGHGRTVTLDPIAQRIADEVVTELVSRTGAFTSSSHRFPSDGANTSIVVLDLRTGPSQGAILAAAGRPVPAEARKGSAWDLAAAGFDTGALAPVGASAWTGRGSHHTPASTWKMVTALTLIDAAIDPDMPPETAAQLAELIRGTDRTGAARLLPPKVLEAPGGICPPRQPTGDTAAPQAGSCGPNHLKPIQDSGRGGPLTDESDTGRFGLAEAVAKSSNIWFTATLLKAEAAWHAAGHPFAGRLALTAGRLGLLDPLSLDGGLGLNLLPRDPAAVEALDAATADMGMLARAAFGQRVQAGPLITAQIAGSIATGRDLRPSLLAPVLPAGPLFTRPEAAPLLDALRDGMKWTVQSGDVNGFGRGTAFRYFVNTPIQDRTFGKTGTGQRGEGLDRLSTFAGWLEDDAGQPLYAIGCATTVRGIPTGAGVSVPALCQKASVALLQRLDAKESGS